METSTWRILDAAINRACEGLRVSEDFARMTLNDQYLAGALKSVRHHVVEATSPFALQDRLAARDSQNDVGRQTKTDSEFERQDVASIVRANMSRVQQSLRTIEEYSKLESEIVAGKIEGLRFESYSLEKALINTLIARQDLNDVYLYVLLGCQANESEFERLVSELVEAKVGLIQLRDKTRDDRELIDFGKRLSSLTRSTSTRWIMNDRPDLAVIAGADGVHLGQTDMTVGEARQIVGGRTMVGVSTHSIEQARAAVLNGADYIGVGPVFPSSTKEFSDHVGLELVNSVANEIGLPAFPIGGIDADNISSVVDSGIHRAAVSAAVEKSNDPRAASIKLIESLKLNSPNTIA